MKTPTPLKTWFYFLIIFSLLQLIIVFFVLKEENKIAIEFSDIVKAQYHISYQALVHDFDIASDSVYKVIVVGSSLVGRAVECPNAIKKYALQKYNKEIQLNTIFLSGDQLFFLSEEVSFFKKISALKPNLLLIQSEWLSTGFDMKKCPKGVRGYTYIKYLFLDLVRCNRHFFFKIVKNKILNKEYRKKTRKLNVCSYTYLKSQGDTLSFFPKDRYIKDYNEFNYFYDDLQHLLKSEVDVLLLDIPRPPITEKFIHSTLLETQFKFLLKKYKNNFNVKYWRYKGQKMYFKDFMDYGHLNPKGREIYSKWLVDQIVEKMLSECYRF